MNGTIIVSACLMGTAVRYDGTDRKIEHPILLKWEHEGRIIAVCPEVAGGLATPRVPAEIQNGNGQAVLQGTARVVTASGDDVTEMFISGARKILAVAIEYQALVAILTDGSPSCGSSYIYSGRFDGSTLAGQGVTAALLEQSGIPVFNQSQYREADRYLHQQTKGSK